MSTIVLFEQSVRELKFIADALAKSLLDDTVRCADSFEQALAQLRLGSCDLLVASVPRFTYAYSSFIARAQAIMPGMPILVLSTAPNAEVSSNVWRLGVTDYLLKPFRPSWLVAAIRVLLASSDEVDSSKMVWRRDRFVKRIGECLQEYKYKNCVEITREYVDVLYDTLDRAADIGAEAVAFAEGMASLAGAFGSTCRSDAENYLNLLRLKFGRATSKYDTYVLFEKLVGKLFDLIDREGVQGVSAIQRVLTHIDRCVHEELTLVDIAKFACMSPSSFSKYFKRETGQNFVPYVTDGKMEYACVMLLESDMSIIQIANDLSYNGANYFSKTFKKRIGVTPTEYRYRKGQQA